MKKIIGVVLIFFFIAVMRIDAHSGRTDSSGGHNCNVGACAGTYHYHNGGGGYNPPPVYVPPIPKTPDIQASILPTPNEDGTFNVFMDWNDVPNTGFSVALSKYAGADPGPLTDTTDSEFTFTNVYPGTYYANMKVGVNGTWTNPIYWTVEVPEWYQPEPTTVPSEEIDETANQSTTDISGGLVIFGLLGGGGLLLYKVLKG